MDFNIHIWALAAYAIVGTAAQFLSAERFPRFHYRFKEPCMIVVATGLALVQEQTVEHLVAGLAGGMLAVLLMDLDGLLRKGGR